MKNVNKIIVVFLLVLSMLFISTDVYAGDYVSYISNDGDIKEGWVANEEDDSAQYVIDEENDEEEIVTAAQYLSVVPSTHQVIASFNAQDENYTEDAVEQIKNAIN